MISMSIEPVSPLTPDWNREYKSFFSWDPSRALLANIRIYQKYQYRNDPLAWLMRKVAALRHRFWSVITAADIPINTEIGGGLLMPHPNGIVIHPGAIIGPNCLIFQQVTIGTTHSAKGAPKLGGRIDIGAGAKVLGNITIGDNVKIGANSVVLKNVPEGVNVAGIPAVVLKRADSQIAA